MAKRSWRRVCGQAAGSITGEQFVQRVADNLRAVDPLPRPALGQDLTHLDPDLRAFRVEAQLVRDFLFSVAIPLQRHHHSLHPFAVEAAFAIKPNGVQDGADAWLAQPLAAENRPNHSAASIEDHHLRYGQNFLNAEAPEKRPLGLEGFRRYHFNHRRLLDFFLQAGQLGRDYRDDRIGHRADAPVLCNIAALNNEHDAVSVEHLPEDAVSPG